MTCYLHSLLWEGIHFSYTFKIFSSILPFSPIPNFRNMPFVLKGLIFPYFLNSFFYDPLLLSHSMLLGGGGCCVSNYVSFNFFLHCCVLQYFERAQIFYIFEKSLVQVILAKPRAEVSKKGEAYRKWLCHIQFNLSVILLFH